MPRLHTIVAASLVAGASLLCVPGCQSGGGSALGGGSMTDAIQKLAGEWVLKQIEGTDVASLLSAGAKAPNLSFGSDGRVSGFGGVNRLAGGLDLGSLTKGEFKLGNIVSTKMAGPAESMKLEDRFTKLLSEANGLKFGADDSLSLTKGGRSLLDFAKAR